MEVDAGKIEELVKGHGKKTKDLRDRMDNDLDLSTLQPFEISEEEGEWDNYTTNHPSVLSNKISAMCAAADLTFTIPLQNDTEPERKKISYTERFVYGAINKADDWLFEMYPLSPPIKQQTAWYVSNRGWICWRFILRKEGDNIIPDLSVWDIRNTYWGFGKRGLMWVCYLRYGDADQVKEEYGSDLAASADSKSGQVKIYDFWDDEKERKCIGNKIIDEHKHGCKKVPCLILPQGEMPYVKSAKREDTIKHLGESVHMNNRNIYETKSRLVSYYMTVIGMGVKTPTVIYYAGENPPEFEKNPYVKGRTIFLNVDKKQEAKEFFKPTMPQDAAAGISLVSGELSIGGLNPIMHGEVNQQMPAAGMALLTHAGMTVITPRLDCMARAYTWLGNEMIRQYKNSEFGEMELYGIDSLKKQFSLKFTKDKLIDDRKIIAKLKADMPQDALQNAGIASQLVEARLMSRQTAQDRWLNVADTDLENQLIMRDTARQFPPVMLREMAASFLKDGRDDLAQIMLDEIKNQMESRGNGGMPAEKGLASQPGVSKGMIPSSLVRGGESMNIPTEVKEAIRLQRLGLERGR